MSFASSTAQRVTTLDLDDQRSATKQMMHDYLDHFRFAAERLQNAVRAPEQAFDLADWRPVSLQDHLKSYDLAVRDGYDQLSDDFRALFEDVAHLLDTKGTGALVAIRRQQRRPMMDLLDFADLCTKTGQTMMECLRRAELVLHPMRAVPRNQRPQLEVISNVLMG